RLVAVQLAVHGNLTATVLTRNRLDSGCEVNDAEARVPERHAAVGRHPAALSIGTPVVETAHRTLQAYFGDRLAAGEHTNDSTHSPCSQRAEPAPRVNDILRRREPATGTF